MKKKLATLLAVSACLVGYFVMTAWADEREIDELHEKAAATMRAAKQRALDGNADEARELAQRAQALRAEAEELAERQERREHEERERHEQPERHHDGREQIEHLRQAADHLHAAGRHELAEDLMREVEQRERELAKEHEGHHDEGLHRRVAELTHHVADLTHHVEKLAEHVEEQDQRSERMKHAIRELSRQQRD